MDTPPTSRYIVYACPSGSLAEQLAAYFAAVPALFAENPALGYPPHCSLTGFFTDDKDMVHVHLQALDGLWHHAWARWDNRGVRVANARFEPRFHGLELESPWVRRLITDYAVLMAAPPLGRTLRLKEWLHLSYAYRFPAELDAPLRQLAARIVDPTASAEWELRFYEQRPDLTWLCHRSWPL